MKFHRTLLASLGCVALLGMASPALAGDGQPDLPQSGVITGEVRSDGSTQVSAGNLGFIVEKAPAARLSDADLAARAPTFTCDMNVQNAHGSTHVAGTINVVVVVKCQIAPTQIRLATSLIRTSPSYSQWHAGTKNESGVKTLQNNASTSCAQGPGQFRGWGWGTITPPPGYELQGPADYNKYGNITGVACGVVDRVAPLGDDDVAEKLTLTFVRSDLASE